MISEAVISERGQLTLPKELRDWFGLKPGTVVTFASSDKGLLIRKAPLPGHDPLEEVFGILKDGLSTDHYLRQIRGNPE